MRILVYGAGAIGSFVGGLLQRAGNEVTLLCREEHAAAIKKDGLKVEGLTSFTCGPTTITSSSSSLEVDLVILTTKAYDTEAAAAEIAGLSPVPVLSLQNGLDNHVALHRCLGFDRVFVGTTSIGVTLLGPGRVRHAGNGTTKVGEPAPQADATMSKMIATLLTTAGLPTERSPDILSDVWKKGVVNNAINPLTAVHRCLNGRIADDPELRGEALDLALEAEEVGSRLGRDVKGASLLAFRVARETRENRSSMLQDVERGKRTEIDAITGVIVREAHAFGIPVPKSEAMLEKVRALERGGRSAGAPEESSSDSSTRVSSQDSSSPRRPQARSRTPARSASAPRKKAGRPKGSTKRRSRD